MAIVSIIVPVYNTGAYLRECLESVLAQTLGDWELICVDDGSTDDSPGILADFAARDARVQALKEENSGQGTARNLGFERAHGKYVLFMDSDDVLEPSALVEAVGACERDRLDHLLFGAECFSSEPSKNVMRKRHLDRLYTPPVDLAGRVMSGRQLFCELSSRNCFTVSPCLRLMRREPLEETRLRFPERVILEDNAFTPFAVIEAARAAVYPRVLYHRRLLAGSTTTNKMWRVRRAADGLLSYAYFLQASFAYHDMAEVRPHLARFSVSFCESVYVALATLTADERHDVWSRIRLFNDKAIRVYCESVVCPPAEAFLLRIDSERRRRNGLFSRIRSRVLGFLRRFAYIKSSTGG